MPEKPVTEETLADRYPLDRGLATDAAVLTCESFEDEQWCERWAGKDRSTVELVAADESLGFEPLQGQALRIAVPRGEHYGANYRYRFQEQIGEEPEAIYFRYYLRFADDWDPAKGGKLPGIGGTYNVAGWGGRPSDGSNGWSVRGLFNGRKHEQTSIGFYCYHADMIGPYGDSWTWRNDSARYLENNRWYCVEQYIKLNTPGENDGILRGWTDGVLSFERTDLRWRNIPELKIECIWIDIYHGGKWVPASDDHLYVDNVVVARERIGPMRVGRLE